MQHNEDLCVTDGSSSRLQGIGINKHMQCMGQREWLYMAENSKALIVIGLLFPT